MSAELGDALHDEICRVSKSGDDLLQAGDPVGQGEPERAIDELIRAHMGAGQEIFAEEDPKYFQSIRGVLKPPSDQVTI